MAEQMCKCGHPNHVGACPYRKKNGWMCGCALYATGELCSAGCGHAQHKGRCAECAIAGFQRICDRTPADPPAAPPPENGINDVVTGVLEREAPTQEIAGRGESAAIGAESGREIEPPGSLFASPPLRDERPATEAAAPQFKHVEYGVRWDKEHGFRNLEGGGPLSEKPATELPSAREWLLQYGARYVRDREGAMEAYASAVTAAKDREIDRLEQAMYDMICEGDQEAGELCVAFGILLDGYSLKDQLLEARATLRQQLQQAQSDYAASVKVGNELRGQLQQAEQRIAGLREGLRKHGKHSDSCAAGRGWQYRERDMGVCSCGLAALLKEKPWKDCGGGH